MEEKQKEECKNQQQNKDSYKLNLIIDYLNKNKIKHYKIYDVDSKKFVEIDISECTENQINEIEKITNEYS